MSPDTCDVSVVIPVFNGEDLIGDAVSSVLGQTRRPMQVVVVDDGSSDGTQAVLACFGSAIDVVTQANRGVARARNEGIARSFGRWVAFLDADDLWHPDKLEAQLDLLAGAGGSVVCSGLEVVDASLRPLGTEALHSLESVGLRDLLERGNLVGSPSSVVCERERLVQVGGFAPALSFAADWDLWCRLACHGPIARSPRPLVQYRVHADNMSRDATLIARDSDLLFKRIAADPGYPDWVHEELRQFQARQDLVIAGCFAQTRQPVRGARRVLKALRSDLTGSTHSLLVALGRRVRGERPGDVWDR